MKNTQTYIAKELKLCKSLIINGQIEKALENLSIYLNEIEHPLFEDLAIIITSYKQNDRNYRLGLISNNDFIAKSTNALLKVIKKLEHFNTIQKYKIFELEKEINNTNSKLDLKCIRYMLNQNYIQFSNSSDVQKIMVKLKQKEGSLDDELPEIEIGKKINSLIVEHALKSVGLGLSISLILYFFLGSIIISGILGVLIGAFITLIIAE